MQIRKYLESRVYFKDLIITHTHGERSSEIIMRVWSPGAKTQYIYARSALRALYILWQSPRWRSGNRGKAALKDFVFKTLIYQCIYYSFAWNVLYCLSRFCSGPILDWQNKEAQSFPRFSPSITLLFEKQKNVMYIRSTCISYIPLIFIISLGVWSHMGSIKLLLHLSDVIIFVH